MARILVGANLAGHDSHGVLRVPTYLQAIQDERLQPAAAPIMLKETPTTLLLDGQNGFGHYTAYRGMALAIEKARQSNICCVNFVRTGHIGRLGEYAEQAARAGCVGLTTVGFGSRQVGGRVTPFGGLAGVLGTNPISVGVPTGDNTPFVLDYATSVVAEGKLQVARSKGLDVPPGYIVDKAGQPTVKTADFYDGGALLPFGNHKGYALSLLICLLGGLSGQFDTAQAGMGGPFIFVMNIEAFTPLATYQQNVRTFLDAIKGTPSAPDKEILAPGDFEQRNRSERLANGVPLPDTIYQQLRSWAEKLNVPLEDGLVEASDRKRYQ